VVEVVASSPDLLVGVLPSGWDVLVSNGLLGLAGLIVGTLLVYALFRAIH